MEKRDANDLRVRCEVRGVSITVAGWPVSVLLQRCVVCNYVCMVLGPLAPPLFHGMSKQPSDVPVTSHKHRHGAQVWCHARQQKHQALNTTLNVPAASQGLMPQEARQTPAAGVEHRTHLCAASAKRRSSAAHALS